MSLISNIAKTFNFKIPESLSNISKSDIVNTVKNLAKVAGDTFLAPSTDGKGIFQSEINILGMRLKNPVETLAEKLLGKAGDKIREMGFSTDAIAGLLGSSTTVDGTSVSSLSDRLSDVSGTKTTKTTKTNTSGVGGGNAATTTAATSSASNAVVTSGVGGSTTTTSYSGGDLAEKAISTFSGSFASLDDKINTLIAKGENMTQAEGYALQLAMSKRNELYQLLSQLISMEHETKKTIIGNIR